MSTQIISFILISILYSCKNEVNDNTYEYLGTQVDTTVVIIESSESYSKSERDFVYFLQSFISESELQKNKVVYPITIENKKITSSMDWNYLPLFKDSNEMPILHFDKLRFCDHDIYFERITAYILNIEENNSIVCNFQDINNDWKLINVKNKSIKDVPDYEFILFVIKFSEDSIFQTNHIVFPLQYNWTDARSYEVITDSIQLNSWRHIDLREDINNLLFFDSEETSDYRNIGIERTEGYDEYIFNKQNGEWKLIKYSNIFYDLDI